jgi:hypothetical protein
MIPKEKIAEWKQGRTDLESREASDALLRERDDLIALLRDAQQFAANVAIASEVDRSEWNLHRGMAGVLRDKIAAFLASGPEDR